MSNFTMMISVIAVVLTSYVIWDGYNRKRKSHHKN